MIRTAWRACLLSLGAAGCGVSDQWLGDDTFTFPPGEIVGICIPNDAGVDGGVYHLSEQKYRECTRSPAALLGPDCPFAQCLAFIDEVCERAEAQGKQALGCAL